MKKFYTMLFAALAVCAVSCQEGPIDPQSPETETPDVVAPEDGQTMTFTATIGQPTKVTLGPQTETSTEVLWEDGDAITIFDKTGQKAIFTADNMEGGKGIRATFRCASVPDGFEQPYVAVYGTMNQDIVKLSDDKSQVVGVEIPSVQKMQEESYDKYAAPLVAKSTNHELYFKNVATLLQFTVQADGVNSVIVWGKDKSGEPAVLTGIGTLTGNLESEPEITFDNKDGSYVKLEGAFVKGKTYYVAIKPTTFSSFSIELNKIECKGSKRENTFGRSNIVALGDLTFPDYCLRGNVMSDFSGSEEWTGGKMLVKEGAYLVYKNKKLKPGAEFAVIDLKKDKILKAPMGLNRWYTLSENNGNMQYNEPLEGAFDIYMKPDASQIWFSKAGEPGPDTYKVPEGNVDITFYLGNPRYFELRNNYILHVFDGDTDWTGVDGYKNSGYHKAENGKEYYKWSISRPCSDLGKPVLVQFQGTGWSQKDKTNKYILEKIMYFEPNDETWKDIIPIKRTPEVEF